MSNKSRKLLFLILFLWILAIVAIYLAMGEPSDVEPLKGLSSQAKPLEQVLPKVPPLEPPQRPADELEGYGLCPTQGSSNGTFENISGHYDSFNRYVVILKLQGQVIAPSIHESLANARLNVTFADFPGQLNFVQEFFYEKGQGPVSVARLGLHRGFTRLSLNYHTQLSPKEVSVEVKCRDNAVALRYTFDISQKFSAANAPLRPEALPDPLAPTPNTQAQVDQLNQGPSLGQGAHETNEISLKPNEQSQEIITPSEPAKSTAEPKEVSDELAKEEPTTPSEHTDVHISIHKDDQLADKTGEISHPKDESLHAYEVCAPPTVGRGALGPLKGQYDSAGRYTVYFDLNGVLSRPKIITDLTGPAPVTYMDFPGNYTFQSELYRESKGPVRQIRYGQHQGFFRLSLTYREGREPKAAEPIIYCSQGKIAIVYTFIGGPTTEEALKAFNQINAIIPKPDYPYGLAPCSFVKQGNGSFGQLSGGYDEKGRYVIAADFSGSLGEYKQVTDHTGDPSVTFLDFSGLYKFSSDPIQETKGPVRLARFGAHDQVTRLSLTYRLGLAPTPPAAEIFCSATRLAIRYTFGELTDITKEYDETLAETIIPDDLAAKAGQPDELTTEISQPDESTTETIRPDEPTEKDDLAQYRPCPVDREAKGTLGQMTSHYDSEGRFVLLVDYTGQIGKYKYQSQLSEPIPFSYLDLMGELNFKQELLTNPTGPVRQVRIGQHNDFARLSFTYREKIAPKETKIEVLCHNNSLAVRYTFEDNGAAKKAAIDAFKPTVKSETAILAADDSQQTLVESDTKDSAQELTFPETNDTNETQATEEKEETEVTEVKEETEKTEETDFTGDTTKKLDPTSEAKRQATTVTVSRAAPSNPILSQPTLTVGNPGYIWSQPSSSQNTPEAQAPDLPANSAARGEDLRDEGASSNLESNTPLETENTSDTTQEMANEPISSTDQATHAAEIPVEPKAGNEISQSDQTTEAAENPVEPKPGSENSLDILNPLSQYAPCPLTGQGHGTISQIRTAFEAPNRFLIFLEVKGGQFGSLTSRYDHEAKPAVFISTFEGHFKTLVDFVRGFNGPVEMVRVSLSDNSLDLSVIFLDAKAPKSASMEALCRQETMVLIYTLAPDDAPIDQTKSP